ncbi:hypothetical protein V1504DRAFT_447436 [Lipomyces starkeyi]
MVMENKATEQGGAAALPSEMTNGEASSTADPGTAHSKTSADNSVSGPSATVPAHNLSKSTHMKTKKPAPMGTRNTAAATQRASSASSRQQDRIASLSRSTAASAARTTTTSAATASAREFTTTFKAPSRLLEPTEASKAHASALRNDETRAPVRSRPRASAPPAVGNASRPVQRAPTKSAGVRPFAEPTASSSRLSSNAGSKRLAHTPREGNAARTLRNEGVHGKPAGPGGLTADPEAMASRQHHRNTAEGLVIATAGSAQKVAAVEDKISDADIERDKKMSELSAELEASKKKLHDSTSMIQQQADSIAGLKTKCCEYEQKITELEKELAAADEKHDAAVAKLQSELINSKQMHVTEIGNFQRELSADKRKCKDEAAGLSEKLAAAEQQVNLRERELEGNSKVIKSLQEELNTTVETMEEARKTELEKLAKSYDGWRDQVYVDGLQKELEILKFSAINDTEISSLKKTISDLEAKKSGQKDLITALETKVEVLTATIESQGEQNTTLGASNESLSKEVEKLVRQLSETNQKLQDVLAQQNQLEALTTVLQSEKATADKNMADMRQIFGELERNVDSLNSELKA